MILADDNFATIIKAVANGRNVYRNIKNAIQFLLSGNMAGILCVLYTSLLALPLPFAPVHLLFINLITDSLPAIAIGMEPPEEGLLKEPPRNPKEGILTMSFIRDILVQGALIAAATMWAYTTGLHEGGAGRCPFHYPAGAGKQPVQCDGVPAGGCPACSGPFCAGPADHVRGSGSESEPAFHHCGGRVPANFGDPDP